MRIIMGGHRLSLFFWEQLFEFCEIKNSEHESKIDNFRNSKRTGENE